MLTKWIENLVIFRWHLLLYFSKGMCISLFFVAQIVTLIEMVWLMENKLLSPQII